MVKRILSFVGREISGLHEAAYLLAGSAIMSLVFALVRDRLLASTLGTSTTLDLYYAAFRVPDLIYVVVASLVSTSILVPFLVESKSKGGDDLKRSISDLFSAFSVLIIVVCGAAFALMPQIERFLFPQLFAQGLGDELVMVSRILLSSPLFLGIAGFFTSITQIQNRFLVYALSVPLYNVGIIIGILFFLPSMGASGLAWGVALGAVLLCLAQIPIVIRDGLFPRLSFDIGWSRIRKVTLLSVPRTLTMSSQQLTTIAFVSFASFLGVGSISIFNFALNLQSVPLSIIGASYSSAAFPVLARIIIEQGREAFMHKLVSAFKHIIFWSVPITVLFIVLRAQIVRTVLGSGAFSWSDTKLTAAALALFVVSSVAQSMILLFVRSFYAEGKTSKPLFLNIASMVFTIGAAFLLIKLFLHWPAFAYFMESLLKTDGTNASVLMLPLAFSLGSFLNLALHWRSCAREFPGFSRFLYRTIFQSVGSSIVGGYAAYASLRFFDDIFGLSTVLGVFMQGLCAGLVGIAAMIVILWLLKSPEMRDILITFKHKVWRVDRASLDRLQS
ncbi:MAG: lipid II flippase MurJ [Candidatus Paceibacterota bacterium]|jgi:putative peptidoglycan lipid II flippase